MFATASATCFIVALATINVAHGAISIPLFFLGLWLTHYSEVTAEQVAGAFGLIGLVGIIGGLIYNFGRVQVWGY